MTEPVSAPSPLTDSAVRKLARRRGYGVRKLRGKDRYSLIREDGSIIVANEHCVDPDDCYFTKSQLVDFLRTEPLP